MKLQHQIVVVLAATAYAASAAITVTNGDFEHPSTSVQTQNIPGWYDHTGSYIAWQEPGSNTTNGTAAAVVGSVAGAFFYQSIGTLDSGTISLDWSFDQIRFAAGNSGAGVVLTFFQGNPTGTPADGTVIWVLGGLSQIGSQFAYPTLTTSDATRSGSLDVSGIAAGTQIWMAFDAPTPTAGGTFALVDNINVAAVPEPSGMALASLAAGMILVRRRRR